MRAIRLSRFADVTGGIACVETPEPRQPAAREVTIALVAFAIHPADLLLVNGRYLLNPPLPATPGMEAVARVIACGSGVSSLAVGDIVLPLVRQCWVERMTVAEDEVIRLDTSLDPMQLAMVRINALTAFLMLQTVRDRAGGFIIQNAANSVVGLWVDALARQAGLQAINVVRSQTAAETLRRRGVANVIVQGPGLKDKTQAIVGDGRLGAAFDAIGGSAAGDLAACLDNDGKLVLYGRLSDAPLQVAAEDVLYRGVDIGGFSVSRVAPNRRTTEIERAFGSIEKVLLAGFRSDIEAVYPMQSIAEAVVHSMRPGRKGKILVTPDTSSAIGSQVHP